MNETGEIILYQPEGDVKLEVRIENETVWLTQAQMAKLFKVKENTITYHIQEIFESEELEYDSTTRKIRVVRNEGKRKVARQIDFYNLDMIISIGYRVNSKTGVKFRRWASQVLKDYMLKGYAINQRLALTNLQIADRLNEQRQLINKHSTEITEFKEATTNQFETQNTRISAIEQHIDFFVKATQSSTGGIIAPNTRFDGIVLIADLVKTAKRSIVFIDPFADITVLKFAAMRANNVTATIYSARINTQMKDDAALQNKQHPGLELKSMREVHDRFLLIDDTVYHFGASFKDMGNGMSAYSVLNFITPEEVIKKVK